MGILADTVNSVGETLMSHEDSGNDSICHERIILDSRTKLRRSHPDCSFFFNPRGDWLYSCEKGIVFLLHVGDTLKVWYVIPTTSVLTGLSADSDEPSFRVMAHCLFMVPQKKLESYILFLLEEKI